jgi:hypothetical protein
MTLRSEIGVTCAGGCGLRVVPVQADDCASRGGAWYCAACAACFASAAVRRATPVRSDADYGGYDG